MRDIKDNKIKEQILKCKCNSQGCTATIKNERLKPCTLDGIFLKCWCYSCNIYITKILSM